MLKKVFISQLAVLGLCVLACITAFMLEALRMVDGWGVLNIVLIAGGAFILQIAPGIVAVVVLRRPLPAICISSGLTLSAMGILFRIQHWPGAAILMVSGIVLTCAGITILVLQRRYGSYYPGDLPESYREQ
jgi:hypothetical protein